MITKTAEYSGLRDINGAWTHIQLRRDTGGLTTFDGYLPERVPGLLRELRPDDFETVPQLAPAGVETRGSFEIARFGNLFEPYVSLRTSCRSSAASSAPVIA
jgi:hypothetical protein